MMFRTIKWNEEYDENQKIDDNHPIFHIKRVIKQPSRIRSKDQFIAALKKVKKEDTEFHAIDGYDKNADNFYDAYKEYIDNKLK